MIRFVMGSLNRDALDRQIVYKFGIDQLKLVIGAHDEYSDSIVAAYVEQKNEMGKSEG